MKLDVSFIWGFLTFISFWNTIDSSLKLVTKIIYRMVVDDKDITMVATSITTFILFLLLYMN